MKKIGKRGQGLVEYGLVIALISLVCIALLTGIGGGVADDYDQVSTELNHVETSMTGW
ncbi:MAG TPA: Flp family type IVb pilin [Candidatus Ozemobacteraceae bacterium]|nr:Flp family type IVb pilin [Candidatus Ozemobacteraceae bacterium]